MSITKPPRAHNVYLFLSPPPVVVVCHLRRGGGGVAAYSPAHPRVPSAAAMGTPMPKVKIPTPAAGSLRLLAASAAGVGSLYTMYKYGLYNGTSGRGVGGAGGDSNGLLFECRWTVVEGPWGGGGAFRA